MPENQYFRQPSTQDTLVDILFVWSKLNADIGYRQGMHEVLALVLWVVERDAVQSSQTRHGYQSRYLLEICLDSKFVTHDSFTLFSLVMQNAKASYELGIQNNRHASQRSSMNPPMEAPMVVRSKRVISELLAQADPALAAHLKDIDIVPQVFLM